MKIRTYIMILMVLGVAAVKAQDIMQWDGDFDPIILANIDSQEDVREGSSTAKIILSGDVEISADISAAAQLSNGTDVLVTEYKISFDGNGTGNDSGAVAGANYVPFGEFLPTQTPLLLKHVPGDDEVVVTLSVRANNDAAGSNRVPDSGLYNAEQTLTITWVGP